MLFFQIIILFLWYAPRYVCNYIIAVYTLFKLGLFWNDGAFHSFISLYLSRVFFFAVSYFFQPSKVIPPLHMIDCYDIKIRFRPWVLSNVINIVVVLRNLNLLQIKFDLIHNICPVWCYFFESPHYVCINLFEGIYICDVLLHFDTHIHNFGEFTRYSRACVAYVAVFY